jgi:hypothetical protein
MPTIKIKDKYLTISLNWFESLFWPKESRDIPFDNIQNAAISQTMPYSFLCIKRPVINIPGLICIGGFFPEGLNQGRQFWCFTKKHKAFLSLTLNQGLYKKIVLGMSKDQAEQLSCKINALVS